MRWSTPPVAHSHLLLAGLERSEVLRRDHTLDVMARHLSLWPSPVGRGVAAAPWWFTPMSPAVRPTGRSKGGFNSLQGGCWHGADLTFGVFLVATTS